MRRAVQVGPARQSLLGASSQRAIGPTARAHAICCGAAEPSSSAAGGRHGRDAGAGPRGACGVRDDGVALDLLLTKNSRASKPSARTGAARCGPASRPAAPRAARSPSTADRRGSIRGAGRDRRHRRLPRPARPSGGGPPGVGESPDGVALAWNLVAGVNDPPDAVSERAVWVAGEPHEAPPVSFAADLSQITCEDGSELRFLRRGRAQPQREPADRAAATTARPSAPSRGPFPAGSRSRTGSAWWSTTARAGSSAGRPWRRCRRSSASSSLECIAPISSRSGSTPAAMISIARSTSTSPASRSSSARTSSSTSGSSASR